MAIFLLLVVGIFKFLHAMLVRETKEGWPLPTVETEVNGDLNRIDIGVLS